MSEESLKKTIVKWGEKIGRRNAVRRLVLLAISPSMAERLVKGEYESKPHPDTVDQIRSEMAKDGFKVPAEKAS